MTENVNLQYNLVLTEKLARIYDELGDVDLLYNQLETNPHPVLITNLEGRTVYINDSMQKLSGYTSDELMGQNPNILKSGDQPSDFYERLWETIEKGKPFESRFKNKRKDGSFYWVYSTIKPLKNIHNQVSGYISIQEDITNLVRLESLSITNEEVLINLVKNLPNTGILILNVSPEKVFMAEGELINELFPDKTPTINDFERVFGKKGFHIRNEVKKICKNPKTRQKKINVNKKTIDVLISPLSFGESSKSYCSIIIRDVSDYQVIIEKVQKSEQQLEAIFQNAGIGIGILNTEGNYIRVNNGWSKMIGYDNQEIAKMNVRDLILEADIAKYRSEFRLLTKGAKHKHRMEMRFLRKDEEILWGDVSATTITDGKGTVIAVIAVVSDITEKKKTLQALEKSEMQSRELNATKDRFFSILAHDLKNPFGSIIGLSELAIEDPENTSQAKALQYLEAINKTAGNAYNLLQNLLEWSRIQTGAIAPVLVHTDLYEIVESSIELVNTMAGNKKVELRNNMATNSYAICDQEMMGTVIRNLLSNAIKYSYENSHIDITSGKDDEQLYLSIRDYGLGIDKKQQKELFQITRAASTPGTANEEGTGLGLILVNDFIRMNNGQISVESELGKGTTFTISLPRYG